MQRVLYYPADHGPMHGPLIEEAAEAVRIAEADPRRPMALARDSYRNSYTWQSRDYVSLHVTAQKPTRSEARVKFRAHVSGEKRSAYWGFNIEIAFPKDATAPLKIRHLLWTGKRTSTDAETFEARLATVTDGLAQALEGGVLGEEIIADADARAAARRPELARLIGAAAASRRDEEATAAQERNRAATAHAERLNAAPDGTPLVIRGGLKSRHQKLGIKRGTVPKALAAHSRVATKDDFEDPVLKGAGISRHVSLFMLAAADRALTADPGLAHFDRDPDSRYAFHPTAPLHPSYRETGAVVEARKDMPVIWVMTGDMPYGRAATIDATGKQSWRQASATTVRPNFPGPGEMPYRPSVLTLTRYSATGPFRDAETIGSFLTFSEAAVAVFRDHETGATEFTPVDVVSHDGETRERRYVSVFREGRAAILTGQSPEDLVRNLSCRAVLDYELVVDGAAHGDLDLWHDTGTSRTSLLLSGRLLRALKRAGVSIGMAPKKATVQ